MTVGNVRLAYQVWGAPGARPLVLLHAAGESASDWRGVAPSLSRHRQVYALDLRGHGRSGRPGVYSLELMRDDVLGFMDALDLERVDLIGHSMGGIVAHLVASECPERVRRLVLEDVPAPQPREPTTAAKPEGDLPFDWEAVIAVRRQIDEPDPKWLEQLRRITAETLVLGGGADSQMPQNRVAELAQRIPGARLTTIHAGHLIHNAEPEKYIAEVLEFLR